MYKFNGKEKILQTIERLDKCLVLADNSVKLMIVRKRLVRYLQETYGITLM